MKKIDRRNTDCSLNWEDGCGRPLVIYIQYGIGGVDFEAEQSAPPDKAPMCRVSVHAWPSPYTSQPLPSMQGGWLSNVREIPGTRAHELRWEVSKVVSTDGRHILDVLKREHCWLTFDELYSKAQCSCDWMDFALQLEQLVEQGVVEYTLPDGMDVGRYQIKRGHESDGQ